MRSSMESGKFGITLAILISLMLISILNPIGSDADNVKAQSSPGNGGSTVSGINATYPPGEIEWKLDLSVGSSGYTGKPSIGDLDGDGYLETLVIGNSYGSWDDMPGTNDRGDATELFCMDHMGNVRWKFLLSDFSFSSYSTPVLCDLESDGFLDILFSGMTGDWSDFQGVLYCLDADANVRWKKDIDMEWMNYIPAIGNLDGDPELEIVFTSYNKVLCLDHKGNELWSVNIDDVISGATIADLNNNGRKQVLFGTWNGLVCMDGDPSDNIDEGEKGLGPIHNGTGNADLIWYREFEGDWYFSKLGSISVADLLGDGRKEIITTGSRGAAVCLNSDGKTLWESDVYGLIGNPAIGDINGDGTLEVVAIKEPSWKKEPFEDGSYNDDDERIEPEDWSSNLVCLNGTNGKIKWSYATGWGGETVILGDTDGDHDLELFFSSEQRILAIDGDEDMNGNITEEEVLWSFHSGSIWGWANTFVLGDVDHDGQLELVSTASEIVYCISVGGRCPRGTIEWGKLHFDLENTNHYVSGIRSGVRIFPANGPDESDRAMVAYGEAGETVVFDMMVKNIGRYDAYYGPSKGVDFEETFDIATVGLPVGWWVKFDRNEVNLRPMEMASIRMEVKISLSAYSDASARIEAVAFSRFTPSINDTQETVTIVKGEFNLKLSSPDPIKGDGIPARDVELNPGDSVLFRISVSNLGRRNDTARITYLGLNGWNRTSNLPRLRGMDNLPLSAREKRDIILILDIPRDASSGEHILNVTATSKGDPFIKDTLKLLIMVESMTEGLHLIPEVPFMFARPGEEVFFDIDLINNVGEEVEVDLGVTWTPVEFNASINVTEMTLKPGDTGRSNLSVIVPDDAFADTIGTMVVTAEDRNDPRIFDSVEIWVLVEHVYDLAFDLSNDHLSLLPGEMGDLLLNISNLGNGYDHFSIEVDNLSGRWGLDISPPPVTLDPIGQLSQTISVNITVHDRAETGPYEFNITCVSEGGKSIRRTVRVHVEETLGISLSVEPGGISAPPGSEVHFSLSTLNLGNGRREYFLLFEEETGLKIDLPDSVILDPFSFFNFTVGVKIPDISRLGPHLITIRAWSQGEEMTSNSTKFTVIVIIPDLSLDAKGMEVLKEGKDNVISVRVILRNLGNSPAHNVTVSVYRYGKAEPLASQRLGVVYSEQEVYLQWIERDPGSKFEIMVDPNNEIDELDETNNMLEFTMKGEDGGMGLAPSDAGWVLLVIITSSLLFLVTLALIRRRSAS